MGKRKIKPNLRPNAENHLIEVRYERMRLVLCGSCYRKRLKKVKFNKSNRINGYRWNRLIYPYQFVAKPSRWENVTCYDCGKKNANQNAREW